MSTRHALDHASISLESLFTAMPVAMALIDREGRHVALNQALASISGSRAEDLLGRRVAELNEQSGKNIENDFKRFDAGLEVPDHELSMDGRTFHVSVRPLRDESGFAAGLMVALTDITARKETERKLAVANSLLAVYARQDHLTGLLNRRSFDHLLDREVRRALRGGRPLSLLLFDVDHFKGYNDAYGHAGGDECLRAIATAVRGCLQRPGDEVCRYGGEEFAVLLPETGLESAVVLAERLRAAVEALGLPHERNVCGRVTVSFGVACLEPGTVPEPEAGLLRDRLVREADKALYMAKDAGRNRVHLWRSVPAPA